MKELSSTEGTISYLKIAQKLELAIFEIDAVLNELNARRATVTGKRYDSFTPKELVEPETKEEGDGRFLSSLVITLTGPVLGLIFAFASLDSFASFVNFFIYPFVGVFLGFLAASLITWVSGTVKKSEAKREADAKNELIKAENARRLAEFEERLSTEKRQDTMIVEAIDTEIDNISQVRKAYYELLNSHYQDDVLYQKYRTIPAICQIIEYLESGRFTNLPDSYNQYELEIRLDRVVTKLDDVIRNLQAIKDQQLLLYQAMSDVSASIQSVRSKLSDAVGKMDAMTLAQESTAYCSAKTAEAVSLLADIEKRSKSKPKTLSDSSVSLIKSRYVR